MKRIKLTTFTFLVAISFTKFANAKDDKIESQKNISIAEYQNLSEKEKLELADRSQKAFIKELFPESSGGAGRSVHTVAVGSGSIGLGIVSEKMLGTVDKSKLSYVLQRDLAFLKGLGRVIGLTGAAATGWEIGTTVNNFDKAYLEGRMGAHVGNVIGPLLTEGDIVRSAKTAAIPSLIAFTKAKELVGIKTAAISETNK